MEKNYNEAKNLKLTFCSGAGAVTGANFLLEIAGAVGENNKKILIDCGMEQGTSLADETNWSDFPYDPAEIDILFVTHAHIDHIGRIPKLVAQGFKGRIISTDGTRDLALPMLEDTCAIMSHYENVDIKKMYTHEVVAKALSLWEGLKYHADINLDHGFKCNFYDSGHILGSAMLHIEYGNKKILFTGDLGNSPSPLLRDTDVVKDIDYLIMESVYGDRNHESKEESREILKEAILRTIKKSGTLLIPVFSLEKTQVLLYEMNSFVENGEIPEVPVFLDSPLAIKLTEIYKGSSYLFNEKAQELLKSGDDIFRFP